MYLIYFYLKKKSRIKIILIYVNSDVSIITYTVTSENCEMFINGTVCLFETKLKYCLITCHITLLYAITDGW